MTFTIYFSPIKRSIVLGFKVVEASKRLLFEEVNKERIVSKKLTMLIIAALFLLCCCSCSSNRDQQDSKAKTDKTEAEVPTKKPEPKPATCNYFVVCKSLTEFKAIVNSSLKELQSPLRINEFKMHDKGEEVCHAFQFTFDDELFIVGSLNPKDSSMRNVLLGWVFKENPTSYSHTRTTLNFLATISAFIAATNPTMSASDKGEILNDLGLFDFNADGLTLGESYKEITIRNGISYTINISKGQSISFLVEQPT
jgi:hypothetical protein